MQDLPASIDWPSYAVELGKRVYIVRNLRGLGQERLAILSGVSRNQISNIERSTVNPKVGTIFALARALRVPPAVLLPQSTEYLTYTARFDSGRELFTSLEWPTQRQDLNFCDTLHRIASAPASDDLTTLGADTYRERPDGITAAHWEALTVRVDEHSCTALPLRATLEGSHQYSEVEEALKRQQTRGQRAARLRRSPAR
ncbi:MAG: helix-turn-helix transcriptional regulator [Corynebacterium sp.]|nr:helix-turn-helix transcriptional regulator [Corynebacterium sp.]